jgi:hypothetical protein
MPALFTADWSGVAEGDDATTGTTNLDQVTAGWVARAPNDPAPHPELALEREDTASGTISWDNRAPILPGDTAWIRVVASLRAPLSTNAALAQLMDEGGTPISQAMLMTTGQIRVRDQTTTVWTSVGEVPTDGSAWTVDLRVEQTNGNGRCRVYLDASDPTVEDSGQYDLGNNVDTPPELARWGVAAAQDALVGLQLHHCSVWDEWPPEPGEPPAAGWGKVWNGSAWVDSTAQRVWDGSTWVDATGAKVWNGTSWVDL